MKTIIKNILIITLTALPLIQLSAQNTLSPKNLLSIKAISPIQLSPDASRLLYSVYTPRTANEAPGSSHKEYRLMDLTNQTNQALFKDNEEASSPSWSPDGKLISMLKKTDGINQVWIKNEAGELFQITHSATNISNYQWNPSGQSIIYIASQGKSEKQKALDKKGYNFIFYEENIINDNLWLQTFDSSFDTSDPVQLTQDMNVWNYQFDHNGKYLAYTASPKKLIDQNYMFRKIHIMDLDTKTDIHVLNNEGKLGHYYFSPDGTKLAYAAALNINDHQISQAYYFDLTSGETINITPQDYKGHISWVNWKNDKELVYMGEEGVYNKLYTYSLKKQQRKLLIDSSTEGVIFSNPLFSDDFKSFIFSGTTPKDAANLYSWNGKKNLTKLTDINPDLANRVLGEQETIHYPARDGKTIEGLLIKPVNYDSSKTYPLILFVHGGPESHHTNGWLSGYSTPGQIMAGKGYMVAYINYRSSTGYGVDFAMEGLGDPAGKEFDDLADAIDYLVAEKGADKERVGMAGGSYGGYASAWFATYYTKYVKAVGVFVGISNVISKRGTTDIPYEELYVHSGKPLEEQWQLDLTRSPIYYAHQSKTATLIFGGADDPRVHPTQSYELYRRMKINGHPAVRLVQYPGEGHGNRKQVGRIDVLYRQIAWMDWYVRDLKPLDGPMPPLDISDQYGIEW